MYFKKLALLGFVFIINAYAETKIEDSSATWGGYDFDHANTDNINSLKNTKPKDKKDSKDIDVAKKAHKDLNNKEDSNNKQDLSSKQDTTKKQVFDEKNLSQAKEEDLDVVFSDFFSGNVHELEKERYMLRAQKKASLDSLKALSLAKQRSGYFIGSGLGLNLPNKNDKFLASYIFKAGYIEFYEDNFGLKGEINANLGGDGGFYAGYDLSFSILQEFSLGTLLESSFTNKSFWGFFSSISFSNLSSSAGFNLGLGFSLTFLLHHRLEFQRYIPLEFTPRFSNLYSFSYSYIF